MKQCSTTQRSGLRVTRHVGMQVACKAHARPTLEAKERLLELISDTGRGYRATNLSRGIIEEAQASVA